MPNHVTNTLTVTGDANEIQKLKEFVKGKTSVEDQPNDKRSFSFNSISPMPSELEGFSSPAQIVSKKEYEEHLKKKAEAKENDTIHLIGNPMTKKMQSDLIKKYGTDSWYNWRNENWDTKWDAYEINDENWEEHNTIVFQTAWSTPLAVIKALSVKFPELEIHVEYFDEDFGNNVGKYTLKNGNYTNLELPKNKLDGLRMAIEISGDYEYIPSVLSDNLFDEEDFDDKDSFVNAIIQIAVEDNVKLIDVESSTLLNKIIEKAVEMENYEYADYVRKELNVKGAAQ